MSRPRNLASGTGNMIRWFAVVALVAVTWFLLVGAGTFAFWFWLQVF